MIGFRDHARKFTEEIGMPRGRSDQLTPWIELSRADLWFGDVIDDSPQFGYRVEHFENKRKMPRIGKKLEGKIGASHVTQSFDDRWTQNPAVVLEILQHGA